MTNNANSKIWGPSTWYTMHIIAYQLPQNNSSFPKNIKDNIVQFYTTLSDMLPCPVCKRDYKKILYLQKIKCSNGNQISRWTYDIHNHVNAKIKKNRFLEQDAKNIYLGEINYKKIKIFVFHILELSNNKSVLYRKRLLTSFVFLLPSPGIKGKLQSYISKNPLEKVRLSKDMTLYIQNISKLICT